MDNITHTVTGLLLSRAGLNRLHPRATAILMISANIPDVDVISLIGGPVEYLAYHRGFTHSFAAIPFMALGATLLTWPFGWHSSLWIRGILIAMLGVLTHVLLDWTNIYGIRLFLPFDPTWHFLATTSVIDLCIWGVYAIALFWPFLSRLVSSEIGAKPTKGKGFAILALMFVLIYNGARGVLHSQAIEVQNSRLFGDHPPRKVFAGPNSWNVFQWRGIVETESAFHVSRINLLLPFDPTAAQAFYKPERIPGFEALQQTRPFRVLSNFSPFLLYRVVAAPEPPGAVRVEAIDLRFGDPGQNQFRVSALVSPDGKIIPDSVRVR